MTPLYIPSVELRTKAPSWLFYWNLTLRQGAWRRQELNESTNVSSSEVTGATEPGFKHFVVFPFCQISPTVPRGPPLGRGALLNLCPPGRKEAVTGLGRTWSGYMAGTSETPLRKRTLYFWFLPQSQVCLRSWHGEEVTSGRRLRAVLGERWCFFSFFSINNWPKDTELVVDRAGILSQVWITPKPSCW